MYNSISKNILTKRIKPDASGWTVAAGTSNVASDIVDTAGYESVRFIVGFGAMTASTVCTINAQQNTANSTSGMADLEGTSITIADTDDNKIAILEIVNPRERYLRCEVLRATANAVVDFMVVELRGSRVLPVTSDATTVVSTEVHISPAEGTA